MFEVCNSFQFSLVCIVNLQTAHGRDNYTPRLNTKSSYHAIFLLCFVNTLIFKNQTDIYTSNFLVLLMSQDLVKNHILNFLILFSSNITIYKHDVALTRSTSLHQMDLYKNECLLCHFLFTFDMCCVQQ